MQGLPVPTVPIARLRIGLEGVTSGKWTVRGQGPHGFDFEQTDIVANGPSLGVDIEADDALVDVIDYISNLAINWTVERLAPTDPDANAEPPAQTVNYGATQNPTYITGAPADGALHTVLHIGTVKADGKKPVDDDAKRAILDAIWGEFSDNNVQRVSDGETLKYAHVLPGINENAPAMLADENGEGQCNAWVDLFFRTLLRQGVVAAALPIDSKGDDWTFTVKAAPAQGSPNANYLVGTEAFAGDVGDVLNRSPGFNYHVAAWAPDLYPDRIYDPSYGRYVDSAQGRTAKEQYEFKNVVAHYAYEPEENPQGEIIGYQITARVLDDDDEQDLIW